MGGEKKNSNQLQTEQATALSRSIDSSLTKKSNTKVEAQVQKSKDLLGQK